VLHYYFSTDSPRACVIGAVNQGGDADTTGGLAGMLAGATHGAAALPTAWVDRLDRSVAAEIRAQTRALLAIAQRGVDDRKGAR
jgi:ADP-ribosyl-[dinitrogen reductase] hydrolase